MFLKYLVIPFSFLLMGANCTAQTKTNADAKPKSAEGHIVPGAERINVYVPLLKGKRVGVFANQTSMVGNSHLVDTLQKLGVNIRVIFGPEHGFRGTADAGQKIGNYVDEKTKVPVVSLYGNKRRPSAEDLRDVDILIFDIQDVGVRFYTYISSLEEYMEAAIAYDKPLLILDRPNPNGFYVDGPVLEKKFRSFVGMQPVPVVYGMTIGEYAKMIWAEKWMSERAKEDFENAFKSGTVVSKMDTESEAVLYKRMLDARFRFIIIPCENYSHKSRYELPVKPSPNLPEIQSIYWYPSTCFFEGTVLSEGRGTEKPFQIFGHPTLPKNLYQFTPVSKPGATEPKLKNQRCYGWNISGTPDDVLKKINNKIQLKYLIDAYRLFPDKEKFFIRPASGDMDEAFFNKLVGNSELMKQLKDGKSEEEIRKTWQPKLIAFKKIRKKYLLYPDFE